MLCLLCRWLKATTFSMQLTKTTGDLVVNKRFILCLFSLSVRPALSVCLTACLSVRPSVRIYECRLSICPSVYSSVCPSLYVCLSVCLSDCLPICLSVCLSVCPSVRPSVCMYVKYKKMKIKKRKIGKDKYLCLCSVW